MKIIFRSKTPIQTELTISMTWNQIQDLEKWILISVFENYSAPKYKQSQQWQQISVMATNLSNEYQQRHLVAKPTTNNKYPPKSNS